MTTISQALEEVMRIDGCICAAVVDSNSGMILGSTPGGGIDLEIAAAGNTEVVRAKLKTMEALNIVDIIQDILISLGKQYHIICPLTSDQSIFIYAVLDHSKANLALARRKIRDTEKTLTV